MTNYEILEVSENASPEEIKKAYKYLCKQYHPDVFSGDPSYAEKKMKDINQAYEELMNDIASSQDGNINKSNIYVSKPTASSTATEEHLTTEPKREQTHSEKSDETVPTARPRKGCGCATILIVAIIIGCIINWCGWSDTISEWVRGLGDGVSQWADDVRGTSNQTQHSTINETVDPNEVSSVIEKKRPPNIETQINLTIKNRVFGETHEGRSVDFYFDGERIGSVGASSLVITSEEDYSITTSTGTHIIEFRSVGLFQDPLYSKWEITISDLGAYLDVKLSDDGDRIDAEFTNNLAGHLMFDGMYYIEEVQ